MTHGWFILEKSVLWQKLNNVFVMKEKECIVAKINLEKSVHY